MQDIYNHPLIGAGYGGLERAFIYGSYADLEIARVEIDVASGAIHNGFIAGARVLGVPALLVFLFVYGGQILFNGRRALHHRVADEQMNELHCFTFANLVALIIAIFIGADLNQPMIWFYLTFGVLVARINEWETKTTVASENNENKVGLAAQPATV